MLIWYHKYDIYIYIYIYILTQFKILWLYKKDSRNNL
jgi:hypothetical protein